MISITKVHSKAKCTMTGKQSICVDIVEGRDDDAPVTISLNALNQLLRMRAAKSEAKTKAAAPKIANAS